MTTPHAALRKYFTIRRAGTPSSTVQLDFALSTNRTPGDVPEWLVRHCEVGDAIARLDRAGREYVEQRWEAAIAIDECNRAVRVAASKEMDCKRSGDSDGAKRWRDLAADADAEARNAEAAMAGAERMTCYRLAMRELVDALGERLTEVAS